MSLKKLVTNYAAYNLWANETLVNYLETRTPETLTAEVPSSFNSIVRTLNHILAGQEFWLASITQTPFTSTRYGDANPDPAEVFTSLIANSHKLLEAVSEFSEDELEEQVLINARWFTSNLSRYEYIMHVANHGTYHRGQAVTIGRNLGFTDTPMTDYNFYNIHKEKLAMAV